MIQRKPISTKISTQGTVVHNPVTNNIRAGKMSGERNDGPMEDARDALSVNMGR